MKEKLKKQKRNITLKITAVLLVVWLLVSVVLSVAVITIEKETLLKQENSAYSETLENISYYQILDTDSLFTIANSSKLLSTYQSEIKQEDTGKAVVSCGAYRNYNDNLQITMDLYDSELENTTSLINTDEDLVVSYRCSPDNISWNSYYGITLLSHGLINFENFRASMTDEQYDSICKYLNTKADADGNYYELICKELYYDGENFAIIPKTVEIVLTNQNHTWYIEDEVVQQYELNPEGVEKLSFGTCANDYRNVISGQFVVGNYSSGGLLDDSYDIGSNHYNEVFEQVGAFTYVYKNASNVPMMIYNSDEITFEDEEAGIYYFLDQGETYQNLVFSYAKHINVLDSCKNTLIFGVSALFLFFLIIGIILTIMMCKVMKTQMVEEQKRMEVTNALAHDIKTPLFIISGYAQNLKENINTDKREHYAQRIIERTDEVNDLVHTMLDFSKLSNIEQNSNLEDIDVFELSNGIITRFDGLDNSNNIVVNKNSDCLLFADKKLITRALSNIISNAVRYSDKDTDIVIDINEKSFSISNVCSNITDKDINQLCEPYYKAEKNRESKGNGLGLSIVKSIVELHGYKLNIELNGNIITFTIVF